MALQFSVRFFERSNFYMSDRNSDPKDRRNSGEEGVRTMTWWPNYLIVIICAVSRCTSYKL